MSVPTSTPFTSITADLGGEENLTTAERALLPWLRGTFHGVTPKHLPRYLDEFSYRFDRRWREDELFAFALRGRSSTLTWPL